MLYWCAKHGDVGFFFDTSLQDKQQEMASFVLETQGCVYLLTRHLWLLMVWHTELTNYNTRAHTRTRTCYQPCLKNRSQGSRSRSPRTDEWKETEIHSGQLSIDAFTIHYLQSSPYICQKKQILFSVMIDGFSGDTVDYSILLIETKVATEYVAYVVDTKVTDISLKVPPKTWLSPPCPDQQGGISNQHVMPVCDYDARQGALFPLFILIGILTMLVYLG